MIKNLFISVKQLEVDGNRVKLAIWVSLSTSYSTLIYSWNYSNINKDIFIFFLLIKLVTINQACQIKSTHVFIVKLSDLKQLIYL